MSSTRSAGLRVLAWLCLCVLTLPRSAAAQKCTDPSFEIPGSTTSSGGSEPREMALASFNHDPYPDLAVQHGSSNEVGILLGDGSGFTLQTTLSYGTVATILSDVVAADFDHDGWDDVAVSATTDDQVYVSLSDRSGGFKTERGISVGKAPTALTFGDYNDDGHLDIAVFSSTNLEVTILKGDGFGDFSEFFTFLMDGASQMATGDVNQDGVPDIVAVDSNNDRIYAALIDRSGALRDFVSSPPGAANPDGLALGDFNEDGVLDLVTVSASKREVDVLRGDGSGGFASVKTHPTGADVPVRIAAGDVDQDGDLDVAVSDKGRNLVHVLLGDGKGDLGDPTPFETAGLSLDVHLSDADLDGRNDIALAISDRNAVESLRNDHGIGCPNASFERLSRPFPVSAPKPIAVADFDRDGSLDFVTANLAATSYTRYLGLGNGVFTSPESGSIVASLPSSNAPADFNFDGDVDVAVAFVSNVAVQNNNAGSLGSSLLLPVTNGVHVAAADVSGDGKPDIVVARSTASLNIAVLLNDGSGGFVAPVFYTAGTSARAVAVADFNGDGLPDLAVAEGSSQIILFKNEGLGTFTNAGPAGLSASPTALRTADMNGDGNNDLVVTVGAGALARLQTLVGDGGFGFSLAGNVLVGDTTASPQGLELFDFNRDGRKDVAVALSPSTRIRVFQGNGGGDFSSATFTEVVPVAPGAVASGDFDRDGFPDLVVSLTSIDQVLFLQGNGAGRFSPDFYPGPTETADSRGVAHGDFNLDGNPDLVVANWGQDSISVFLGQGGFQLGSAITTGSLGKPVWVTVDDFDSDGRPDVVVSAEGSQQLGFHRGRGDGTFNAAVPSPLPPFPASPYIARAGDFDLDGSPDIVVIVGNAVQYLRNNGAGGFSLVSQHVLGGTGSGLVVGDFNRDGLLDFAGAQPNDHRIVWFLGTSPGTFLAGPGITTLQRPLDFDAGDINEDGFLDLAVPLEGTDEVRILWGDGGGGFVLGPVASVPKTPKVVRLLDYNLDGFLDLAVASEADHVLSFYSGNGAGGFSKDDDRPASVRRPTWMTVVDLDTDGRTDVALVPNSGIDGDPAGVAAIRNTNCRSRHLHLLQDVSTCDTPDLPFLSQPQLRIEDDGQNLIECEDRSVVASIRPGTGSAGASLLPPTSIAPSSGIASYSSLGVDQGGAGFQIQFQLGDARPKLSRSFSQALAPTITGPNALCHGDPAFYTSEPNYDLYDWRLDSFSVTMAPSVDLTATLSPGLHSLDLGVFKDTCSGLTSLPIDVTETLAGVTIFPAGPIAVCASCTGPLATSSFTGGGAVTYQWGYRTTPAGAITPLTGETNPTYTIEGADFGVGTFYLVLTVTPTCGVPVVSNEVTINVQTSTGLDALEAFTALATNDQVRLEFSTTSTGLCAGIRILRNSIDFPPDPHVTGAPNVWIGGADFPCPPSHEADFTDVLVSNDTEYLYSAWVKDAGGSFSTAKNVKSRPFDHTVVPVKWAYSTGATSMSEAGLRISGGQVSVYVVSNDTLVHALDGGALAPGGFWIANAKPYPLGLPSQVKPPVVPFQVGGAPGGALFVTSQDGNVYAINATSMSEIWPPAPVGGMLTGAASGMFTGFGGAKNLIFAGTRNGAPPNGIRAFDVETGLEQWFFSGGGTPVGVVLGGASVDYAGQRIVFASQQGPTPTPKTLWALDVSVDGSVSLDWAVDLGDIDGPPVFLGGGSPRVVVGTNAGLVHLRDASDGSSLWPAPYNAANGRVRGFVFPHTHGGVRYYMFATDDRVTSIRHNGDGSNPTLHWQLPFTSPSTPIALPGTTTALVGSGDGNLYLITGIDTSTPSTVPLQLGDGSASVGTPTFDVVNRVIYVGTEDGVIRAIAYPFP